MVRSTVVLICLALMGGATSGCAVLAPGEGHSGGTASLNDAVDAARRDTTKKVRSMDVGYSTPPEQSVAVETAAPAVAAEPMAPGLAPTGQLMKPPRYDLHPLFGVVGGVGFLGGQDYDRVETFGLTGGNYFSRRLRWDVTGSVSSVSFIGESRLGQAFRDAMDLDLDVAVRYYVTEPYTFMSVYPMAGIGTGTLFWSYSHRLAVVEDGSPTTVGDDRINHFDFYAGAGMSLLQVRHLHIGGNLVGGVRLYGWHTYHGFSNDALPTTGFTRFGLEAKYRP